jgi:hypothetical protein
MWGNERKNNFIAVAIIEDIVGNIEFDVSTCF